LLLFYTYCNIEKAEELGEGMIREIDDTLPVHSKELCFLMGVIQYFVNTHLECLLPEEWFQDSEKHVSQLFEAGAETPVRGVHLK